MSAPKPGVTTGRGPPTPPDLEQVAREVLICATSWGKGAGVPSRTLPALTPDSARSDAARRRSVSDAGGRPMLVMPSRCGSRT